MYCKECGNKINKNNVYCGKCGTKIMKEQRVVNEKRNDSNINSNLLIVISLISLFGALLFGIFILPLAIFGIIMSINKKDTPCLIINVITCFVGIVIFIFMFSLVFRLIYNVGHKVDDGVKDYYDEFKENYKEDYKDKYHNSSKDVDITGTWYLYSNNRMDDSTYYKFNSDNTFMYYVDNDIYIGTYTIDKNSIVEDEDSEKYKLELDVITLIKSDKTVVDSGLSNFSYSISIDKETINALNLLDNTSFVLKKDVEVVY